MTIDRMVLLMAGILILFSLLMARVHSMHWLWFTMFIGVNLIQAAITTFCPMAIILKFFGVKPGSAFYVSEK